MLRFLQEHTGKRVNVSRNPSNPKTQNITLMVGMPVIAHKTDKKINILNSEKFIISKLNDTDITIASGDRCIDLKVCDFYKYLYLGFCFTVHASQGETFTEPYTIYDWKMNFFSKKAKYVAISRGTRIEDIQMNIRYKKEECIIQDADEAKVWYKGQQKQEQEEMDMSDDIFEDE